MFSFDPTYNVITDGGSLNNGSAHALAYGSYHLSVSEDGRAYTSDKIAFADYTTNNQAEYLAIIAALADLVNRIETARRDPGAFTVRVKTDSQLVAKQIAGEWQCKDSTLAQLKAQALALLQRFDAWAVIKVERAIVFDTLGH